MHDVWRTQQSLRQLVVMYSGKSWPSLAVHPGSKLHDGVQARVQNHGEFSETSEVTNGIKRAALWYQHCSA